MSISTQMDVTGCKWLSMYHALELFLNCLVWVPQRQDSMRRFQIVWTGVIPTGGANIYINETVDIVDTLVTPVNTLTRGLQLITPCGDTILPCVNCISRKITETISYSNLDLASKGREAILSVTACILCNGCINHESDTECSIALYIDTSQ